MKTQLIFKQNKNINKYAMKEENKVAVARFSKQSSAVGIKR